jgi:hypothetical protein
MITTVLALQAAALVILGIVAADLYAHKRVEMVGGTNIWGYRGPVAKQRSNDEHRILLVGGTRAYGYGAAADGTIAYALGWHLTGELLRPVNVINAAAMGASAPDFAEMVSRYLALGPDLVCLYDDLGRASLRRRESRVARIARGYTPILPLVLDEKGMAWRYGSVARGYAGEPARGGWPRRMAGASLQWVGSSLGLLDAETAPSSPYDYAPSMLAAADAALSVVSHVLVVVDPPIDARTRRNLAEVQEAVARRADSRISLLVLSDVGGPDTLLDGYSYNAVGRSRVEMAIRAEVLKLLRNKV